MEMEWQGRREDMRSVISEDRKSDHVGLHKGGRRQGAEETS